MRFDSFRTRMALWFAGGSLVLGTLLLGYTNHLATSEMIRAKGAAMANLGRSVAVVLGRTLAEREREIVLLSKSPLLTRGALNQSALQESLDIAKNSYRFYAWMGFADVKGQVQAASGGLLAGQDVSARHWFQSGQKTIFVGDVHQAVLLAKILGKQDATEPLRFVDFAAPVLDETGKLRGVIAAHAHWSWVVDVLQAALPENASELGIEALILGGDGHWLHPFGRIGTLPVPKQLPPNGQYASIAWADGDFLTSRINIPVTDVQKLGWQIIIRQPVTQALTSVDSMHRHLLIMACGVALLFMVLAYFLAARFSHPVERLAHTARAIAQGDEIQRFETPGRWWEIVELSHSLRAMMSTLMSRRHALEMSNASLEQQVQVRTDELWRANQALHRMSMQDALTGLANRRAADEQLSKEQQRFQRTGRAYAVLLTDIDLFKRVNDTYGHEVGDQVLQHVAGKLQAGVRNTDFVARFGGEEFLVLLPETDEAGALVMAEKLRALIESSTLASVGQITMSLGVALASADEDSYEPVIRRADGALYRAKAGGRNQVSR